MVYPGHLKVIVQAPSYLAGPKGRPRLELPTLLLDALLHCGHHLHAQHADMLVPRERQQLQLTGSPAHQGGGMTSESGKSLLFCLFVMPVTRL